MKFRSLSGGVGAAQVDDDVLAPLLLLVERALHHRELRHGQEVEVWRRAAREPDEGRAVVRVEEPLIVHRPVELRRGVGSGRVYRTTPTPTTWTSTSSPATFATRPTVPCGTT